MRDGHHAVAVVELHDALTQRQRVDDAHSEDDAASAVHRDPAGETTEVRGKHTNPAGEEREVSENSAGPQGNVK